MPRRRDLNRVLIVGSGPIVIGQACEFDYSGTQACRALRSAGIQVILVNSNPATIMTDPGIADRTYIEPITPEFVAKVIAREKPDALLPTLGGQTALNVGLALAESGVLAAHGVELIGARAEVIQRAEDRLEFKQTMAAAGLDLPRSGEARSVAEAQALAASIGGAVIIRPSFTLGGGGAGMARTPEEVAAVAGNGLARSPVGRVLVEESVAGWKEFELEVMRDRADNVVIVCSIENLDPMGVHTGDSITVAPALTLTDRCYQQLRDMAITIMRAIGVDTGGANIQFAVNPRDGRAVVIEMNPRVSRSSALASKATGFPIAKLAALLAVGFTLDEIRNDITGTTPAAFEPALDYVVTKVPRFAFDKFPSAERVLGPQMKSVGEVMAIGRTFEESLMKALRSLEVEGARDRTLGMGPLAQSAPRDPTVPSVERLYALGASLKAGESVQALAAATGIDPWFVDAIAGLVALEDEVAAAGWPLPAELLRRAKRAGFADRQLARLTAGSGHTEQDVRAARAALGITPVMKAVDTCAAEFAAETPYLYSTYEEEDEVEPDPRPAVVILGSGPNRIGQGIEFDACCVQACFALRARGYRVILVNSNPETVSTDYDVSDRLYFEPVVLENVLEVIERERPLGVIVQLGGQTPLALAGPLATAGVKLLGTSWDAIDQAENRERMKVLIESLGMRYPKSAAVAEPDLVFTAASRLGYPLLVRPSYVLGGQGMRVVVDEPELAAYLEARHVAITPERPLMLDAFIEDAIEVDVDAVADGETVLVGAVMEHIEEAGIHSGDSSCVTPPYSLGEEIVAEIREHTRRLAHALHVVGLINIQFAIKGDQILVLEVNPRASRTVPFASKATGVPLVELASRVMLGERLLDLTRELGVDLDPETRGVCVKKPVMPFDRFPGEDVILGPEMRSTGEVMGIDADLGRAFAKALLADPASGRLPGARTDGDGSGGKAGGGDGNGGKAPGDPDLGSVFISVRDRDKRPAVWIAKRLIGLGFQLRATAGTARLLALNGMEAGRVYKVHEGSPNCVDLIRSGEIRLVINTPLGRPSRYDEKAIRLAALERGVPCLTTISGADAAVSAIEALRVGGLGVSALQDRPGRAGSEAAPLEAGLTPAGAE
jgi:carbamoyl-phosphate synthase large subunit